MTSETPRSSPRRAPSRLTRAAIEIEQHAAEGGWDQPPRMFALVPTVDLVAREPALAAQLVPPGRAETGVGLDPGALTAVEQDHLPPAGTIEDLLAAIAWPADVSGAALAVERILLPPAVETDLPREESAALRWAADHPERQEVRLVVAVLRDGSRECALRFRSRDSDEDVLSGADLVPGLADALAATLAD